MAYASSQGGWHFACRACRALIEDYAKNALDMNTNMNEWRSYFLHNSKQIKEADGDPVSET